MWRLMAREMGSDHALLVASVGVNSGWKAEGGRWSGMLSRCPIGGGGGRVGVGGGGARGGGGESWRLKCGSASRCWEDGDGWVGGMVGEGEGGTVGGGSVSLPAEEEGAKRCIEAGTLEWVR